MGNNFENRYRCITLKALFAKEVVNTVTGERLGYIDDAEIETEHGVIKYFCVSNPCKNLFSKRREVRKFAYDDIVKIGNDIILIKSCFNVPKNVKKQL